MRMRTCFRRHEKIDGLPSTLYIRSTLETFYGVTYWDRDGRIYKMRTRVKARRRRPWRKNYSGMTASERMNWMALQRLWRTREAVQDAGMR